MPEVISHAEALHDMLQEGEPRFVVADLSDLSEGMFAPENLKKFKESDYYAKLLDKADLSNPQDPATRKLREAFLELHGQQAEGPERGVMKKYIAAEFDPLVREALDEMQGNQAVRSSMRAAGNDVYVFTPRKLFEYLEKQLQGYEREKNPPIEFLREHEGRTGVFGGELSHQAKRLREVMEWITEKDSVFQKLIQAITPSPGDGERIEDVRDIEQLIEYLGARLGLIAYNYKTSVIARFQNKRCNGDHATAQKYGDMFLVKELENIKKRFFEIIEYIYRYAKEHGDSVNLEKVEGLMGELQLEERAPRAEDRHVDEIVQGAKGEIETAITGVGDKEGKQIASILDVEGESGDGGNEGVKNLTDEEIDAASGPELEGIVEKVKDAVHQAGQGDSFGVASEPVFRSTRPGQNYDDYLRDAAKRGRDLLESPPHDRGAQEITSGDIEDREAAEGADTEGVVDADKTGDESLEREPRLTEDGERRLKREIKVGGLLDEVQGKGGAEGKRKAVIALVNEISTAVDPVNPGKVDPDAGQKDEIFKSLDLPPSVRASLDTLRMKHLSPAQEILLYEQILMRLSSGNLLNKIAEATSTYFGQLNGELKEASGKYTEQYADLDKEVQEELAAVTDTSDEAKILRFQGYIARIPYPRHSSSGMDHRGEVANILNDKGQPIETRMAAAIDYIINIERRDLPARQEFEKALFGRAEIEGDELILQNALHHIGETITEEAA